MLHNTLNIFIHLAAVRCIKDSISCVPLTLILEWCSPQPWHRELAAERPEAPAPAPVPDAVEEEVDYEADEVDDVAAAPEEPAPHEARRPRANSESKSAAEVRACTLCGHSSSMAVCTWLWSNLLPACKDFARV